MRLDHVAYRVRNRWETAAFFINLLCYRIQQEMQISFDDGTKADSIALEPPEKKPNNDPRGYPWIDRGFSTWYHMAPEIFISDGPPGSIVGDWVACHNGGDGGIHHVAYQVEDVEAEMRCWQSLGIQFSTSEPIRCPEDDLVQVFTRPLSQLGGIVVELIKRGGKGFCADSVKRLMEASQGPTLPFVEEGNIDG